MFLNGILSPYEKCKNKSNTKEPPKKSPKVPKLPYQHIVLIKDKTQRSVIRAINRLERKLGKDTCSSIFKA